jgi:glycogen operon protein
MPTLGARFSLDHSQLTFTLQAPRSTRIELWLYAQPLNAAPILKQPLQGRNDGTLSLTLPTAGLPDTLYYGYRAWGPNWPFDPAWTPGSAPSSMAGFLADVDAAGNRFNPNKLLLDPYALEISHDPMTPAHPDPTAYQSGASWRAIDTGPFAAKGIVLDIPAPDFGPKPITPFKDDIIYEVHLRGLTKNDPAVPANLQGTFAGAALRAPYLAELGITAVEFLPIHETQNALNDLPAFGSLHNYWGYDTINFFAPDRRYAADQSPGGPTREWIAMVKAFHAAGLKVFVDVVYNHHDEDDVDAQTGDIGRIFTLRGLDNPAYYEALSPSQTNFYQDDNGVGPNVNCATTPVRNLVLDSLGYWTDTMGADGFRFDLAAVLGNADWQGGYSFNRDDPANILNRAVAELPARPPAGGPGVDLIAEPYTANAHGQEQGNFPFGWNEWNDRFRDVFRASQNKLGVVPVTPGAMATRFAGSDDLFAARGRRPWNSVNYIVSHDGFTLRDLYSYNQPKNNQPFPFGPSDGGRSASDEMCWDHGGDPAQQIQAARTALAILALSAGTPMITGGSEFFRTQFGNNNAFNLDTTANWLDWTAAERQSALTDFTRNLLLFRRAHPCLRPDHFFTGTDHNGNGLKDIAWYFDTGLEVDQAYFANPNNHFLAYRIDGREAGDTAISIYVAYNGYFDPITATIPAPIPGNSWYVVADTASGVIHTPGQEPKLSGDTYTVAGRSLALLIEH